MLLCGIDADFERLPGPLPMWRKEVDAPQWAAAAVAAKVAGGRLVSVWGSDARARSGGFTVSALKCGISISFYRSLISAGRS